MKKRSSWTICSLCAALLLAGTQAAMAASAVEEAQALMGQGQFEQALRRLDAQLKAQPQDAEARFLRGLVLVRLDRGPEAIKVFADLTRDYPQLPEPYNNLAVLYAQQGDYEKARDALEAALATHPSYATAHENLGDIYAALAGAAYNRALMLDQGNQVVRSKLALIGQLDRPGQGPAGAAAAPATSVTTPPPESGPVPTVPPPSSVPPAVAQPAPSALPPAGMSVDTATAESVTMAINAWAAAWSSQDLPAYFAAYSPDFVPEGGLSRSAWETQRRERISRPSRIRVRAVDPEITRIDADRLRVSFTQEYESDSFSDTVSKVIELQQAGSGWLIVREYTR